MSRRVNSHSRETADISRALRRAAKRALELGLQTGTPVYVMRNNKILDLTKEPEAKRKPRARRTSAQSVKRMSPKGSSK